jgi:hypothetical protein
VGEGEVAADAAAGQASMSRAMARAGGSARRVLGFIVLYE